MINGGPLCIGFFFFIPVLDLVSKQNVRGQKGSPFGCIIFCLFCVFYFEYPFVYF